MPVWQCTVFCADCVSGNHRPEQRYIGKTDDLKRRLAEHNSGKSVHTRKYGPWRLAVAIAFADEQKALAAGNLPTLHSLARHRVR